MSSGTAVSVWAKIKVVLFPEIGREKFFYHSPSRVSEYIFKQTSKQKEIRILKKKLKKKREHLKKSRLKKTNLRQFG